MIEETRPNYLCEFCRKRYVVKHAAEWHEKHCNKNPNNMHKCYDCNHCKKGREDDGSVYFHCVKKNLLMYSCIAERRRLVASIENSDIRMPIECDDFCGFSLGRLIGQNLGDLDGL